MIKSKKQNIKKQLKINYFIIIIVAFVLLLFFTSVYTLYNLAKMLDTTATQFTRSVSETVETKIIGYLKPIQSLNQMIFETQMMDTNFLDHTDQLDLYGKNFLNAYPQLQSFIIGNQEGDFYMLKLETDGTFSQRLIAPNLSTDKVRDLVLSHDFEFISEKKSDTVDFDPRVRPWYLGAQSTDTHFWTDLYIFHTSQTLGVTVSHAYYDDQNKFNGAFGFDINIHQLSQFLNQMEFGNRGDVVLINDMNEIIAYSHPEKIFDKDLKLQALDMAFFEKPEIQYTLTHSTLDDPVILFNLADKKYVGMVHSFKENLGIDWKLILVVPTSEFVAPFNLTSIFMLAMNIMILILIALLIFYRIRELRLSAKLYHFANHDPLTELYNRNYFNHHYNTLLGNSYALIISDIDHFKTVNDTYGHQVGDIVLKEIAVLFKSHLQNHHIAFRWGGEEFLILLENESLDKAVILAEELRKALESKTFQIGNINLKITMSFGVSEQILEHSFQEIVQLADQNLYKAKETGRNKVIY